VSICISPFTFDFVTERASLVLVQNNIVWEALGRWRFLGEDFLGDQNPGDGERAGGERADEGIEPAAASAGPASGAAVKSRPEKTVGDGDGAIASGGEGSAENRGCSSHSV
jgi:hypothetical protein